MSTFEYEDQKMWYDHFEQGFERLLELGKPAGRGATGAIAVALIPQEKREGETEFGRAQWVVCAFHNSTSKLQLQAIPYNLEGKEIGRWSWRSPNAWKVPEEFLREHAVWLGAFDHFGGWEYFERFMMFRRCNGGQNPDEGDRLDDNAGHNEQKR